MSKNKAEYLDIILNEAEKEYPVGEWFTNYATLEDTLDTLKAERFARWQQMMTEKEKAEIYAAHNRAIAILATIRDILKEVKKNVEKNR